MTEDSTDLSKNFSKESVFTYLVGVGVHILSKYTAEREKQTMTVSDHEYKNEHGVFIAVKEEKLIPLYPKDVTAMSEELFDGISDIELEQFGDTHLKLVERAGIDESGLINAILVEARNHGMHYTVTEPAKAQVLTHRSIFPGCRH